MYRYSLKCTNNSSAKFGPCEVCGKHVTEVHRQAEERWYESPTTGRTGWTRQNCRDLFGHEECLHAQRKEPEHTAVD